MEVDKSKSIRQMTLKELRELNYRLRSEREIQNRLRQLLSNSGQKWDYDNYPKIDTLTPIGQICSVGDEWDDKSISQLSNMEVERLLDRLRQELDAHEAIFDLKRSSGEYRDFEDRPTIDNKTPVNELYHYGVLGMKWGIRKQKRALARIERKDDRWLKKNGDKIQKKLMKETRDEMANFVNNELKQVFKTNGKLTSATILQYNRKLADVLNQSVGDIPAPSGRVLRFVAKRGSVGVHQALADAGYDMTRVKNGVYSGGKVAYRNENLMKRGG